MHYSGLLVRCDPDTIDACRDELTACPGVDIFTSDAGTGRIVIVLETRTLEEQETGLQHVQALRTVRTAELVYHYFGDTEVVCSDPACILQRRDDDGVETMRPSKRDSIDPDDSTP